MMNNHHDDMWDPTMPVFPHSTSSSFEMTMDSHHHQLGHSEFAMPFSTDAFLPGYFSSSKPMDFPPPAISAPTMISDIKSASSTDCGNTPTSPDDLSSFDGIDDMGAYDSSSSDSEVKLPPLSPHVVRSSTQELPVVKQEPADGATYSQFPAPGSALIDPASGEKKKKRKGRKRKISPLLNDMEDDDDLDDMDTSCLDKKERNKLSAAKYRKRKKMYIGKLEQLNSNLQKTLEQQKETITGLSSENGVLKSQLGFFKKLLSQSNINLIDAANRLGPSAAKQVAAIMFVLFSMFVITTPLWFGFVGNQPLSSPVSDFDSANNIKIRGRVLLSHSDIVCECPAATAKMLWTDSLTIDPQPMVVSDWNHTAEVNPVPYIDVITV